MRTADPLLLAQVADRGSRARARRPAASSLLRLLLAALAVLALWSWLDSLRREVEAGSFALVRTDEARLDTGPGWVDPRWHTELRALLASFDDVRADDRAAFEALREEVAALSFVEFAGQPSVQWPDGLRLELGLREPVACVHLGRNFLGVAADGVVLSGRWPTPPARDTGFLPVIELPPPSDAGGTRELVPGLRLEGPAAEDALAVAVSMWRELDAPGLARLGRCVIDARRARLASVDEPGTRLRLEGRRSVWFGRSPNLDEPGELPVATKWGHVARALALLEPDPRRSPEEGHREGLDWDLLDARWDLADLHERGDEAGDASAGDG